MSGVRATAGLWLGGGHDVAFEGTGFILPRKTKTVSFRSDPNGNPVLAFRYLDPPVGGVAAEDAFQASAPTILSAGPPQIGPYLGSLGFVSRSQLWGTEANLVGTLGGSCNSHLQILAGFRYADLDESLDLPFTRQAILGSGSNVVLQGNAFPAPSSVSSVDSFRGRTQFYGGQLGARGDYAFGKLIVGFSGKVALGDSHEAVSVLGNSTLVPNVGPQVVVPGGQFAGPSNIGRSLRDEFAVIPEAEVNISYQLGCHLRGFVGYNFLYWSRVVRPGNQVDLIVDTRANPVDPGFTGDRVAFPRPLFSRTDFWAHGISCGLEFRY
jgi:hypothetical protein